MLVHCHLQRHCRLGLERSGTGRRQWPCRRFGGWGAVADTAVRAHVTSGGWIFAHPLAETCVAFADEKGWLREAFAFEAKVHRTYVRDIERGARKPMITVVEKLGWRS